MATKTKYVHKAFTLQHEGEKHKFAVGEVLPEKFHDHWYAKAHSSDQPVPADAGAAEELMAELEGKAKELKAQADKLTEREKAAEAREADLAKRAEALDAREAALTEREKAAEAKQQSGKQQK